MFESALAKRCREQNVKLNNDKVRLRSKEVPFVGHLISKDGLKTGIQQRSRLSLRCQPHLMQPVYANPSGHSHFLT